MDDDGLWVRPRGRAWGNEAQRAVLHAVAEDVAKRTHHKVVAIEALRSDGFLEFVAIAGNDEARDKMLGKASPLELNHIHHLGTGRRPDGPGLGLAIVERVVTRHHGTVRVESVLDEGTTFTVWLPVGRPPASR